MEKSFLVLIFLILVCISVWRWDFPLRLLPEMRSEAIAGQTCVDCHRAKTPGIHADWSGSVHAKVGVDCGKCHRARNTAEALKSHLEHTKIPVATVVSPTHCAGCRPQQVEEYARSKHANTHEIMWKVDLWLNDGMNNSIERTTGCYACHGTIVEVEDGRPAPPATCLPPAAFPPPTILPNGCPGRPRRRAPCARMNSNRFPPLPTGRRKGTKCGRSACSAIRRLGPMTISVTWMQWWKPTTIYYDPARGKLDGLYEAGLLSKERYFDEEIEWQFYELWHHEGRRARMGTAMMAPDYAWWHGFYELKHRCVHFMDLVKKREEGGEAEPFDFFPGRMGVTADTSLHSPAASIKNPRSVGSSGFR